MDTVVSSPRSPGSIFYGAQTTAIMSPSSVKSMGNFLRRLCLPKVVKHWSLRSLKFKLIKDRWTLGAACLEVGVSTGGGSRTQGRIPACIGAYRWVPSSARGANFLDVIRGEER